MIDAMNHSLSRYMKLSAGAAACVAAGAAASQVAAAGASTPAVTHGHSAHAQAPARLRLGALARRTVEGQFVVATTSGYQTVTVARGTVDSVSGQQLTLTEGVGANVYRTVTLTLPGATRVRDNRRQSTLDQVTQGQRAIVLQTPTKAVVIARTPAATTPAASTTSG